jgi:hypothetical protein
MPAQRDTYRKDYDDYYSSLPLGHGQLRLVRVWPAATWDDPVIFSIGVFEIGHCPPYNAVSYTWGGQVADQTIACKCGKHFLRVTESCVDALKGIRLQKLPVVWIDQLCINQFDGEERNSQ